MRRFVPTVRAISIASLTTATLLSSQSALAEDLVTTKKPSLELSMEIAKAAVDDCREKGYQVSAVVVDRGANPQVVLRDDKTNRFTIQIAEEKANAVILSGVASSVFRKNRGDIQQEMNHVKGVLVLEGGVPIIAGGEMIGALGVSGAPGGDKDEECAVAAIESVQETLDFAE